MTCVLFIIHPPKDGAAFGRADVVDSLISPQQASHEAAHFLGDRTALGIEALAVFAHELYSAPTGAEVRHELTGLVFRIDAAENAGNACPCCGRLVKFGDHVHAGSDDTYCDGCYVWGDSSKVPCDPNHTAHPNPWSLNTNGARWFLEVTIDRDGEIDSDYRYARVEELLHDGPEDAARIAWPGLDPEQIISAAITPISKEY